MKKKLDLDYFLNALKYLSQIESGWHLINDKKAFIYLNDISKLIIDDKFKKNSNVWLPYVQKFKFDFLLIDTWLYLANKCNRFKPIKYNDNEVEDYLNELIDDEHDDDDRIKDGVISNFKSIILFDRLTSITRELTDLDDVSNNNIEGLLKSIILFIKNFNYDILNLISEDEEETILLRDSLHGVFLILLNLSEKLMIVKTDYLNNIESIFHNLRLSNNIQNLILNRTINKILSNLNQKSLEESLNVLLDLNELNQFHFKQAYLEFLNIYKLISNRSFKDYAIFIQFSLKHVFLRYLTEILRLRNEIDFSACRQIQYEYPNQFANENEMKLSIFHYILLIINKLIFNSIELNLYFGSHATLHNFISFLRDIDFVHNLLTADTSHRILLTLLVNLSILSKYAHTNNEHILTWSNLNVVECLIQFVNDIDQSIEINNLKTKIIEKTYYILSYLDKDSLIVSKLPRIEKYVEALANQMSEMVKQIIQAKNKEILIEYLDESKTIILKIETTYSNGKTLTGLLDLLDRFCLNEQLRMIIYKRAYFIKTIVYMGNRYEKYYAIKLLTKICIVDKEVRLDLSRELDLIEYVQDLFQYDGYLNYNQMMNQNSNDVTIQNDKYFFNDLTKNDQFNSDLKMQCEKFLQITHLMTIKRDNRINYAYQNDDFDDRMKFDRKSTKHNHILYDQLTRV